MSKLAVIPIPESQILTPAGEVDTRLNGRIAAQFIERSNSELTRKNYTSNLRQFILFSGKKDALDVQVEDVLAWRTSMEQRQLAAHTISTKLATLSALFAYFRDYGIISRNPATTKMVPRPAQPLQSPKGRALSVKEVRYLLYIINRDNPTDLRDSAIIYSILRLSLRVSEICRLKVSDIKKEGKHWVIDYRSKGGRRERQPLPKDVKAVIDDYLEADRSNRKDTKTGGEHSFIFQAEAMRRNFGASQPLTTRHIWHIVKTRGVQAGIGKLAPHDLRRTAITKAFQQNVPVTAILNMSKHKSVETLMIYNKGLDNLENNAVHSLNYDSE
ncbi:MAG: tyrosine-type recombinase/integrase [Acidobacteriota bacterium]|nr:tyrosine-type recombinase/integrase [Acidobacteriota bacterium]